jgi:hypothetical protein
VMADEPAGMLSAIRAWTPFTPKWTNSSDSVPKP